jgi:hypothetical protein
MLVLLVYLFIASVVKIKRITAATLPLLVFVFPEPLLSLFVTELHPPCLKLLVPDASFILAFVIVSA